MDLILRLIEILLTLAFGAYFAVMPVAPAPSPPDTGEAQMIEVPAVIEQVEALLLESYPVQIQLRVSGYHPDGCAAPVIVEQGREGNEVRVRMYRSLPADIACPSMIVPFEETIRLDGGFETGTYTISVNEHVVQVTI